MQKIQFDSSVCANDCMFVHSAFDAVAAGDAVVIGAGRSTKFKLTERALLQSMIVISTEHTTLN